MLTSLVQASLHCRLAQGVRYLAPHVQVTICCVRGAACAVGAGGLVCSTYRAPCAVHV